MSVSVIRQAMRGSARKKKKERKWSRFRTQDLVTAWNKQLIKVICCIWQSFLAAL